MHAIARDGLTISSKTGVQVVRMGTDTRMQAAAGADLILFCVKSNDTNITARLLEPHLQAGALVLSLQNGVDNVEKIHAAIGLRAIPAAVYVAVEMTSPAHLAHKGRGDLSIGEFPFADPMAAPFGDPGSDRSTGSTGDGRVGRVAAWFEAAGVPCRVSSDVVAELWTKLIMNCAVNAISALAQVPYGVMGASPEIQQMMRELILETEQVARAHGVRLPPNDYVAAASALVEAMAGQYSSTAQDIQRGKTTEIEALNGHVARLASRHGVPAPLNRWLTALVKLREQSAVP